MASEWTLEPSRKTKKTFISTMEYLKVRGSAVTIQVLHTLNYTEITK
jgi:hypothetical protein